MLGDKFISTLKEDRSIYDEFLRCLEISYIGLLIAVYDNLESFPHDDWPVVIQNYPEFVDESNPLSTDINDEEMYKLTIFRFVMKLAQLVIPPKNNKARLLEITTRITEGYGTEYKTGSGQTKATARRVLIYEREGDVAPIPKRKKGFALENIQNQGHEFLSRAFPFPTGLQSIPESRSSESRYSESESSQTQLQNYHQPLVNYAPLTGTGNNTTTTNTTTFGDSYVPLKGGQNNNTGDPSMCMETEENNPLNRTDINRSRGGIGLSSRSFAMSSDSANIFSTQSQKGYFLTVFGNGRQSLSASRDFIALSKDSRLEMETSRDFMMASGESMISNLSRCESNVDTFNYYRSEPNQLKEYVVLQQQLFQEQQLQQQLLQLQQQQQQYQEQQQILQQQQPQPQQSLLYPFGRLPF